MTRFERVRRSGRAGRAVSVDAALDAIADNSRVFVSGGSAVPLAIDRAMADGRHRWDHLELVADRLINPLAVFDHGNEPFRLISLQPSPAVDAMRDAGALTSEPVAFGRFGNVMASGGRHPIDVAIVHVSRPGPEGRFSLGVSVATPLAAIASAALVIAQVNPKMPYTFGAGELDRDEIDLLVDVEHGLVETNRSEPDATARVIGATTANLIPNGSVLQIGVGALADAVLEALAEHRNLSVHSGMISDGIVELHAAGAITGTSNPLFPGHIVAALAGGSQVVFDFVDKNPQIVMVPAAISHGQDTLRSLPTFRAVNSAVEVALDGSVNGEVIGNRVISGPGGAPDYAEAANAGPDGRYIVALPATAARGSRSRIVSALTPAAPTTVAGRLVSAVVTEHGVAEIGGLNDLERADALRAIAEPGFRASL